VHQLRGVSLHTLSLDTCELSLTGSASLNGDGRADYMDVYPDTNIAYVYYNLCPGGSV
jgi:hypothetical protein